MGKLFGTDGIRGVVGENLTAQEAFRVGQAIAAVLTEELGRRPVILIGKDTRVSSDMLESALMAGICDVGGDVKPLGTIPTPAVAYLTVRERGDAGIVVSASHNPYEHNGIKVFNAQGYKLSDEVERRVEEKVLSDAPMKSRTREEIGRRHHGRRRPPVPIRAAPAAGRRRAAAPTARPAPPRRSCSAGSRPTRISSTSSPTA